MAARAATDTNEIRRTFSGEHPTKVHQGWQKGEPLNCHAQVLALVAAPDKVAISMNGTAVMSRLEFVRWVNDILESLKDADV